MGTLGGDPADNSAENAGSVYVFVRGDLSWTQEAFLKSSNAESGDFFGESLSLDGDTLAVGAHYEDSGATGVDGDQGNDSLFAISGAAYLFERVGTTWTQSHYFKASNTDSFDEFGTSIALEGDVLAIGAPREDSSATELDGDGADDSSTQSGAVYLFARSGGTWSQRAYIKASNTGEGDEFGLSLALSGNTLVIGAPLEDSDAIGLGGDQANDRAQDSGAVYIRRISP